MNSTSKQLLVAAAIASLVGVSGTSSLAFAKAKKKGFKCEGQNGCKGQGGCKSEANSCKGQNGCKGKGFMMTKNKKECEKMKKASEGAAAEAPPATAPAESAPAEAPKAQ